MNPTSSTSSVLEQKNNPIELLKSFTASQKSGCLRIQKDTVTYLIDLDRGQLTYTTHSLDPFERLERHLRRLSHQVPQLTAEVRTQARVNFADTQEKDSFADYRAIYWLIEQQYLTHQQAQLLIKNIAKEILESIIAISGDFEGDFLERQQDLPLFCKFDITALLSECQKTLQGWTKFTEQILSPYQRPYFFANAQTPPAQTEKLGKILKGFNFRQLAAILNQDELLLAEKLYPLILNKSIVLRDASPPFDRLPKLPKNIDTATTTVDRVSEATAAQNTTATVDRDDLNLGGSAKAASKDRPWKIACIDDSPTILNEMNRFLGSDEFDVATIDDPLKALMKIIRLEPDIILLDVGMPNIDGYKMCALIRKYSAFKDTPIVMVTGNKGLIDRAKAKLAGATDYMTKPFSQSELLDMVFRYLS